MLEKPAENLLKWKDVNQSFFFCWANHSWIRSWEGNQTLLQEQTYGTKKDWEIHFNYLLQFFKDDRYIKKDNKPLFMLFKPLFEEKGYKLQIEVFEDYTLLNRACKLHKMVGGFFDTESLPFTTSESILCIDNTTDICADACRLDLLLKRMEVTSDMATVKGIFYARRFRY